MRIRAAVVWEKERPFVLDELELETPRPDEVLVRVAATGLCHTDLTVPSMLPPEISSSWFSRSAVKSYST